MKYIKVGLFLAAATVGVSMSAFGAAGKYVPPTVTRLQPNVTYSDSTTSLSTYAGFNVTALTNIGPNTINDVTITISAKTDRGDTFSFYLPDFYLSGLLQAGCTLVPEEGAAASPVTITCKIKQLKPGQGLQGFTVFYTAPSTTGGVSPDNIKLEYTVVYAEGMNDCANGCANSSRTYPLPGDPAAKDAKVLLGTTNPIDVRSGVPRNGGTLFTGNGVPKNEPNKKFTEEVLIPSLANLTTPIPYATSTLAISWVSSTDTTNGVQCGNLANFVECPTYTTTVLAPKVNPNGADVPVVFKQADPLQITYRIDASNVKRSESQLLNNMQIDYFPDGSLVPVTVPKTCTNKQASANGVPCVLDFKCYKQNEPTAGLAKDCQLITIGTRNGRLQIF